MKRCGYIQIIHVYVLRYCDWQQFAVIFLYSDTRNNPYVATDADPHSNRRLAAAIVLRAHTKASKSLAPTGGPGIRSKNERPRQGGPSAPFPLGVPRHNYDLIMHVVADVVTAMRPLPCRTSTAPITALVYCHPWRTLRWLCRHHLRQGHQ